jgi:hypothetical protein
MGRIAALYMVHHMPTGRNKEEKQVDIARSQDIT